MDLWLESILREDEEDRKKIKAYLDEKKLQENDYENE